MKVVATYRRAWPGSVRSRLDHHAWVQYVLTEQDEVLDKLAAIVGEGDARIIEARKAANRRDVYDMGRIIKEIRGS